MCFNDIQTKTTNFIKQCNEIIKKHDSIECELELEFRKVRVKKIKCMSREQACDESF